MFISRIRANVSGHPVLGWESDTIYREKITRALFWVGVILVPAAIALGWYGHLITPPGEGEVQVGHQRSDYGYWYPEYFDQQGRFDYDHWHRDWRYGQNLQILAAFLLLGGGVLALVLYRDDRVKATPPITAEEIKSLSLPPPKPRRQRRIRWKLPLLSKRVKIAAAASVAAIIVALIVVPPVLRDYAAGPKHSAVILVTIDDNHMGRGEGEFWIYIDEDEEARGILTTNPSDGSGHGTAEIPVTWHGNSTHMYYVSCWYSGRLRSFETWVTDQQTTSVLFDVGLH